MPATILIAEDYEDNREVLRLILRAAAYKVIEASNGAECLALARAQLPDLILIDLSMPVIDGWGVFQELKSDPLTAKIPCVAVTAHADVDREHALDLGFDAYLSKPFLGGELLQTVERVLPSHETQGLHTTQK